MRRWLVLVGCAWAAAESPVDAILCPRVGLGAPSVATLLKSQTNPASDAWIFRPNCVVDVVTLSGDLLSVSNGVGRVDSVPTLTQRAIFSGSSLANGASFADAAALTLLSLALFSPSLINNLELPPALKTLSISDSDVVSIAGLSFPDPLKELYLSNLKITSLQGVTFPAGVTSLEITRCPLKTLDFTIPPKLQILYLNVKTIERATFPDSIQTLGLAGNGFSSLRGIRWPRGLQKLDLSGSQLQTFEIRRSDLEIFRGLQSFEISGGVSKCSDASGEVAQVQNYGLCVISDENFDSLYVKGGGGGAAGGGGGTVTTQKPATATTKTPRAPSPGATTTPGATKRPKTGSTSSSPDEASSASSGTEDSPEASGSGVDSEANAADGNGIRKQSRTNGSSIAVEEASALDDASSSSDGSSSSSRVSKPSTAGSSREKGSSDITQKASASSSSHTTVIIVVVVGAVVAVLLAAFLYRSYAAKRRALDAAKYSQVTTPTTTGGNSSGNASSQPYFSNDIRNDMALIPFRIDINDVHKKQQIARGGFGAIFQAEYQGRDVAVKQMLPGDWHNDSLLASFMDEIRLCARLNHPKIAAFVGVTWNSLRELAVVIEFMPRGDLHALLHRQQQPPSPDDWMASWTAEKIRSKASIAQDVAEAVEYLHSFESPIIHRDLKARNVLLDTQGNAKLSDFGISREVPLDETMTREIGTAAWIAPEVLRGERYSEKADIYSLGVLLVELDRCRHPYGKERPMEEAGSPPSRGSGGVSVNAMHLALLVSSGKLRPSASSECPEQIASLVDKCLSFEPVDRPTAHEVVRAFDQLSQTGCES